MAISGKERRGLQLPGDCRVGRWPLRNDIGSAWNMRWNDEAGKDFSSVLLGSDAFACRADCVDDAVFPEDCSRTFWRVWRSNKMDGEVSPFDLSRTFSDSWNDYGCFLHPCKIAPKQENLVLERHCSDVNMFGFVCLLHLSGGSAYLTNSSSTWSTLGRSASSKSEY